MLILDYRLWQTRGRRLVDPIRPDYNDIIGGWGPLMDTYFQSKFPSLRRDGVRSPSFSCVDPDSYGLECGLTLISQAMTAMLQMTGCVITRNEEERITLCLQSLADCCDELLVVDSGSTDQTRALAAKAGARVLEREWSGYRSQKQFAVEAASHDWIVFLDADEQASAELITELRQLRQQGPQHVAYRLPFRSIYLGRLLRFGDTARESHIRVFDRRRCRFGGYEIHEKIETEGSVGRLTGHVLHNSYRDLAHQLDKLARYARLMGEQMHAHGKRGSLSKLLFNPFWRFVRGYLFRLGCLDGWRGLVWSLIEANYVRQKYLHLWVLDARQRERQS